MTGRPSEFTQEIGDEFCGQLIAGRSVRDIFSDEDMPSDRTMYRLLASTETLRPQYARARELQMEAMAEDILEIADDGRNDWMECQGKEDGGWTVNGEHIQRSKLRVDARKWLMSKLAPKKYGDKVELEHTGKDGGPIQTVRRVIVEPGDTDSEGVSASSEAE